MNESVAKKHRKHTKAVRCSAPTSSSLWLRIASTPAYYDVVGMSSRGTVRSGWDFDPLEAPTW